jgi:hypothetical protein
VANHKKSILQLEEECGEEFTAFVIGKHDKEKWDDDDRRPDYARKGELLNREQALPILDEEYDSGFGGADCFPFYAWSENYFLTVSEYDGATSVSCWPRNPISIDLGFD